ncbi:MAG: prepilin-type N-terminal cleavage/methylation domain-containing protein [Phycisphaerales bacterium]|nr:prepilin-type N-terminal cleavage/methylation domain-containing protein [Phycisphaerales bacterium]
MKRRPNRPAFTLIELLVVIALIALLISIILPGLGKSRRTARHAVCMSHIQQLALAQAGYWADFKDRVASFTWSPGNCPSAYPDLRNAGSYTQACMNQLVDILRRRTGDDTLQPDPGRLPHRHFSHVVLNDYLSSNLPEKTMACPEDRTLLSWQADPKNPDPRPAGSTPAMTRLWPYSSSYQIVPCAWSADIGRGGSTVEQYPNDHNLFWVGSLPWGKRKMSEVVFPQNKVLYFEFFDRHHGKRDLFYAHTIARPLILMWDGSCSPRLTGDANKGSNPNSPTSNGATVFHYDPSILGGVEPPTLSGNQFDIVQGFYRWTRGGLRGLDYGGTEIRTGNPG